MAGADLVVEKRIEKVDVRVWTILAKIGEHVSVISQHRSKQRCR